MSFYESLKQMENFFHTGHYNRVLSEALKYKQHPEVVALIQRVYMVQSKYSVIINSNDQSTPDLKEIYTTALYLSKPDDKSRIEIVSHVSSNNTDLTPMAVIMRSTILFHEKKYILAIKLLSNVKDHVECMGMKIQGLLSIHRHDLACKELQKLIKLDEDSIVTQLAQIQYNLYMNSTKGLNDAFHACKELIERFGSSARLLNYQGVSLIGQNRLGEAYSVLLEAYRLDSGDGEVLCNIVCVVDRLCEEDDIYNHYMSALHEVNHPLIADCEQKRALFLRTVGH